MWFWFYVALCLTVIAAYYLRALAMVCLMPGPAIRIYSAPIAFQDIRRTTLFCLAFYIDDSPDLLPGCADRRPAGLPHLTARYLYLPLPTFHNANAGFHGVPPILLLTRGGLTRRSVGGVTPVVPHSWCRRRLRRHAPRLRCHN